MKKVIDTCKECGKRVPTKSKGIISFAYQMLHLCRYCYRAKFPEQPAHPKLIAVYPNDGFSVPAESESNGDMFDCANTSPWEWMEEAQKE
ncbi:MAG: hypothetical protein WC980_08900 [Candidatus Brocadiia bacterium]